MITTDNINKMSITSLDTHCVTVFKSASCNMHIIYSLIPIVQYMSRGLYAEKM